MRNLDCSVDSPKCLAAAKRRRGTHRFKVLPSATEGAEGGTIDECPVEEESGKACGRERALLRFLESD